MTQDTHTRAKALLHIFKRLTINPATNCWDWTGSTTKDGYGQLSCDRIARQFGAKGPHRLTKMLVDRWEPAGRHEQVRHLCNNRRCCNPDHLSTGSAKDNADDRRKAGTILTGEKHGAAKLSWDDVCAIRSAHADGESRKSLADRFGVCRQHIGAIVNNRLRTSS